MAAPQQPPKKSEEPPKVDNVDAKEEREDDDEDMDEEPQIQQRVNRFDVKKRIILGITESSIGTLYRSGPVWQGLMIIPGVAVVTIYIGGLRGNRETAPIVVWKGPSYDADVVLAHLRAHRVK